MPASGGAVIIECSAPRWSSCAIRLKPFDLPMPKEKKKPRQRDENLFRDTTMTFGEHLEELRRCLFRALLGLAAGFVLGLVLGGPIVSYIQKPLKDALTRFYQKQSKEWGDDKLAELPLDDKTLPWTKEQIADIVDAGFLIKEVYVDPDQMFHQLKKAYPQQFTGVAAPPKNADGKFTPADLMPIVLFNRIEDDQRIQVKSLSAHEAFIIYIKAALLAGIVIASPWIFYQIWFFVAAGLYPHEKQFVHVFLPFSVLLFLLGAALAFFFVFEPVLKFLFSFNDWLGIDPDPRISEWLGFVLMLPLGFGISFQLPLVMLFLHKIGVFSVGAYLSKWRLAILVIFVLAMFLTPADPTSMVLMAIPLTVLYFGGILLCRFMPRRKPLDELDEEGEAEGE